MWVIIMNVLNLNSMINHFELLIVPTTYYTYRQFSDYVFLIFDFYLLEKVKNLMRGTLKFLNLKWKIKKY